MGKCTCLDYQENKSLYSDAVAAGALKLISEGTDDYVQRAGLECVLCGTKWIFTRDDSYHYPIVEWKQSR